MCICRNLLLKCVEDPPVHILRQTDGDPEEELDSVLANLGRDVVRDCFKAARGLFRRKWNHDSHGVFSLTL